MLNVTITRQPPDIILALAGELDMVSAQALNTAMEELDINQTNSITISLSKLEFIDSTGIGQLVKYHRSLKEQGISFRVENSNQEIEEVLELIGVREIIASEKPDCFS